MTNYSGSGSVSEAETNHQSNGDSLQSDRQKLAAAIRYKTRVRIIFNALFLAVLTYFLLLYFFPDNWLLNQIPLVCAGVILVTIFLFGDSDR